MREDELRELFASFVEPGGPVPPPQGIRGRVRRRRWARGAIIVAAVALVVGLIGLPPWGAPAPGPIQVAAPATSSARPSPAIATSSASHSPVRLPADPHLDVRCRALTAHEYAVTGDVPFVRGDTPPMLVDIGGGFAVMAYWGTGSGRAEARVVTERAVTDVVPTGWDGSLPTGDLLADGPKAAAAAETCLIWMRDKPPQPRPAFACERPTREDLLRVQKAVWGGTQGNPTGGGVFVRGALTPEGKPWVMYAVNTERGASTVLVMLPSTMFKGGRLDRAEFAPLSETWSGDLAEFRGHVEWGVEGQSAALACLGR